MCVCLRVMAHWFGRLPLSFAAAGRAFPKEPGSSFKTHRFEQSGFCTHCLSGIGRQ